MDHAKNLNDKLLELEKAVKDANEELELYRKEWIRLHEILKEARDKERSAYENIETSVNKVRITTQRLNEYKKALTQVSNLLAIA